MLFFILKERAALLFSVLSAALFTATAVALPQGFALGDLGISVVPGAGLPVVLGVFGGPAAGLGCAAGVLLSHCMLASLSWACLPELLSAFFVSLSAFKFWDLFERRGFGAPLSVAGNDLILRLLIICFTSAALYGYFSALAYVAATGAFTAVDAFLYAFLDGLASGCVIGIPGFFLLSAAPWPELRQSMRSRGAGGLTQRGKKRMREAQGLLLLCFVLTLLDAYVSGFSFEEGAAVGTPAFVLLSGAALAIAVAWICGADYELS